MRLPTQPLGDQDALTQTGATQMNDKPEWVVCKLWPSRDTRLVGDVRNYTLWTAHCAECKRKVRAGKRIYQLVKAGQVRVMCDECDSRRLPK